MERESVDGGRFEDWQRQRWDRVAAGWNKWWRTIENGAQHVSERLIDLAEIRPGQRVLDVATGIGEPALAAAGRVGSSGWVVATDVSKEMLEIARERARALGVANVEFIEASVERSDFSASRFDAVLCRWGFTSLADPSKALVKIRGMLTPHGLFAASVWKAASKLPFESIATRIAREMHHLVSSRPETPAGPGGSEAGLEAMMIRAGFTGVCSEETLVVLEFPSVEVFTEYLIDVSPVLAELISDQPVGWQAEFRRRLVEEIQSCSTADGRVRIQNTAICVAGRR